MKVFIAILFFALTSSCSVAQNEKKTADQANIQGVWLAQTESQNGIKKKVSFVYVFSADKIIFTDENGKETTYSFKLDATSNPKLIAIKPQDAPENSAPISVAYELDGDSLTIVVAPPGLRPTEISDKNDQELIVCTRKRS